MTTQIILPQIGFADGDANLVEWMVADGATVTKGQPLFSFESEKAVNEVESPAEGVLKIISPAGAEYPLGSVIGEIH
ncbi:biotin/lipoyl-containing protein [Paraburkholderia sp. BR14374]|uniref:biotin/lipoyl-containing protein n=1 Tax=Paraburkholderia sp. BR14374 TaxID=3237007 RepID=UPI0034CEDCA0